MGYLIKGFSKPTLKQWVIYQGVDVCTGIVVSRKSKIIRKNMVAYEHSSRVTETKRFCQNSLPSFRILAVKNDTVFALIVCFATSG